MTDRADDIVGGDDATVDESKRCAAARSVIGDTRLALRNEGVPGSRAVRRVVLSSDGDGRRGVAALLGYGPGQILINLLSPFVRF